MTVLKIRNGKVNTYVLRLQRREKAVAEVIKVETVVVVVAVTEVVTVAVAIVRVLMAVAVEQKNTAAIPMAIKVMMVDLINRKVTAIKTVEDLQKRNIPAVGINNYFVKF